MRQNHRAQNFPFNFQFSVFSIKKFRSRHLAFIIIHLLFCIEKVHAASNTLDAIGDEKNFEYCAFAHAERKNTAVKTLPIAINTTHSDCELTAGSGIAIFILSNLNPEITANAFGVIVSYHPTLTDAIAGKNKISSPYNSVSKMIYARVTDNSTGDYNTATVNLKVLSLPVATLSGGNIVCGGTPLQLTSHIVFAGGDALISQSWGFLNSSDYKIAAIDGNGVVTGKQGGTATVFYNVYDTQGCNVFASQIITVTPILKKVTFAGVICSRDSAIVQLPGLTQNYTFNFGYYINNSSTFDTVKNVISDAVGNAQFKVRLFSINNGSFPANTQYFTINSVSDAFGCHVETYKQAGIIVYPLPLPNFTGPTAVCSGNSISLTPSYILPIGTSLNAEFWSSSNTNVATVNNGIVTGISGGTADISYRVKDSRLCDSTMTKTIIVTTSLTPSINISVNKTTICTGTNVVFTATPTNGGSNPVYQWQKNGVNVGVNSASYVDSTLGDNDVIICNIVSNAGCLTTSNATSNQITMSVMNKPTLTITGLKKSYCEDDSGVLLSATPSGGTFTVDGAVATTFKPSVLGQGKHMVMYNYTGASGCSSSEKSIVSIDGIGTPLANAGSDGVSQNGIFVLKANTPAPGDSAVWTILNGISVDINDIHAPNAILSGLPDSTKIILRWTIFHGACISYSDITVFSAGKTHFFAEKKAEKVVLKWITFYEKDNDYFEIERSQDGFSFTTIGTVKSIGNNTAQTQYQFIDDAPPFGKIYYRLKTVDKQIRTSFSRAVEIDFSIEKKFVLFPNPFQDYVSFNATTDTLENVQIIITDIMGRILKNLKISLKAGVNDKIIDTGDLPTGIYFFKIQSNDNSPVTNFELRIAKI